MKDISDTEFSDFIKNSDKPVLIDFWAPWCAPCRGLLPIIEDISKEMSDKISIAKINVDLFTATAKQFSITSVPTLLLFKGENLIAQKSGASTKISLIDWINKSIS